MQPNQQIRLQDRALLLTNWLRNHLADEMILQCLTSALFGLLGILFIVLTSFLVLYYAIIVPGVGFRLLTGTGAEIRFIAAALLLVQAILFKRAYDKRYDAENLSTQLAFIQSLLLAGPGMVITGLESLEKSFQLYRLLRYDLQHVATVFVWLFDRGKKATVEEVCNGLLGNKDAVRILPKLGNVPGVVWLTYHHGVIMLSYELRQRLAKVLKQKPPKPDTDEPPDDEGKIPFNRRYSGNVEAIKWYVDLNLPPFTPLAAVKRRYRQLAKLHHPDAIRKNGTAPASDEQFKRINAAYHNILKNSKNK